jgi:PAS domain S-box-containing protein
MSNPLDAATVPVSLRERATEHLVAGMPSARKRTTQSEALAVLYQLASSPETAVDAMALLHELQVHQVELDLQQEELRCTQSDLEAALIRQSTRVERAPVAYMTIDARTAVVEINLAGARLLGVAREDVLGRPLAGFLAADSKGVLQALVDRAREAELPLTCELLVVPLAGVQVAVQAAAAQDTTPEQVLLALMPVANTAGPGG